MTASCCFLQNSAAHQFKVVLSPTQLGNLTDDITGFSIQHEQNRLAMNKIEIFKLERVSTFINLPNQ
jgi:hypothetical protein